MTSVNLTRDEAQHRSTLINVSHYDVELDLRDDQYFTSLTTVKFEAKTPGSTFIDLRADEITEARLNGIPVPLDAYNPTYGIALSGLEVADYELKVTAKIAYSRTGEGLHRFVDPVDDNVYLYTQFETADAKRVFACFDQPDMKATYSLTFHAPSDWKIITNSPVTREGDTWRATVDTPLSTYLIALCAGPYYEITDTWTGELTAHPEGQPAAQLEVPLGLYCRASLAEHMDSQRLFTETKQGFDFYHANFGFAYPFGKYDQIFVPEFNAGAMENAGCVTIRDEYVFSSQATHYMYERRADTILHELAHMWFGDLVTMKWWDDLWLNESFATWAAAISQAENTEYDTAWVTFANVEKSWAYQQDQLPTTHPISTDASDIETVEQNFDGITYAKGASVLKQLQAYVGRENFFAGVRRHFTKHAWGNAEFKDLLGHLEEASGRDLSFWAEEWLKTTGVNTLSAKVEQEGGKYTSFAVEQSGDTLRTHRIAIGLYRLQDGKVSRFKQVEVDITGERTEVAELAGVEVAELVLLNDDDLTYTLVEFDPETVDFVVNNIDKISDPMARTLCWSTAWEMTRAGTMRARDFAQLVARGLSAETELAVLERICNQATVAVSTYADPQWAKEEGFALLAGSFLAQAQVPDADSSRTIVFKQALTKLDLNDAARDYLIELRESSDDKALRWKALAALIANGAEKFDEVQALVAQELEADNTASGYQASLRALAAFNSDENKRGVWDEIMSLSLSNLELRHKLEGLTMTGSEKHLGFAVSEYFANAESVWSNGSTEIALGTIQGLYPSWIVTQETIDATDEFLKKELPGGLRRAVTEERDRLARTLRNRAIDAQ